LVIGYYSTPSNSIYGKTAFGSVIIIIAGVVIKILHLYGGNELILAGLAGIAISYGLLWYKESRSKQSD